MWEVTADNARDYLIAGGRLSASEAASVHELAGGVSNVVFLVELPQRGARYVLKQARGRLRVQEEWLCPVERIWREVETLRISGELLNFKSSENPSGSFAAAFLTCVPEVLWEDRGNFAYAMTAAPAGHKTWKELLLAGELPLSLGVATAGGQMLARLHGGSWRSAAIAARLDEREFFDQLRIDPYYRQVAKVHPDLAPQIEQLIDSVWQQRLCLVHGDFSPKNLLVWPGRVMLIDFEVGHYGDPAFDLGFFLTHLVLKASWSGAQRERYLALAAAFWNAYRSELTRSVMAAEIDDLERRALWNLAGCLLARVDGKSPVDYLNAANGDIVRRLSKRWIELPPQTFDDARTQLAAGTER